MNHFCGLNLIFGRNAVIGMTHPEGDHDATFGTIKSYPYLSLTGLK